MFSEITGAQVLLRKGGVFKPAKLYSHNGELYVAAMGGYVKLYENGATTVDKLNFTELHFDGGLTKNTFGQLRCDGQGAAVPIEKINRLMLGGPGT